MIRKFKKPIAYFLLCTLSVWTVVSCQKNVVEPSSQDDNQVHVDEMTPHQKDFLRNLESLVENQYLETFESTSTTEKSGRLNPANPNNPYDETGKLVAEVFIRAIPNIDEAIETIEAGGINKIKEDFINSGEEIVNETVSMTDFNHIVLKAQTDPFEIIHESEMSAFAKEISISYISDMLKLKSHASKVAVSKAYENVLTDPNAPDFSEKENILRAISAQKYLEGYLGSTPGLENKIDRSCGLAIVGFVVTAAGLVTLTAASGGLATGIAVVGFIVASASLGDACGNKKAQ